MPERDDEVIRFMITFGVADDLLRLHVDDRSGHCRVCSAGPQAGRTVHPCTLRVLAEQARAAAAVQYGRPRRPRLDEAAAPPATPAPPHRAG